MEIVKNNKLFFFSGWGGKSSEKFLKKETIWWCGKISLCSATFEWRLQTFKPCQANFPLSDSTLLHLSQWRLKTSRIWSHKAEPLCMILVKTAPLSAGKVCSLNVLPSQKTIKRHSKFFPKTFHLRADYKSGKFHLENRGIFQSLISSREEEIIMESRFPSLL